MRVRRGHASRKSSFRSLPELVRLNTSGADRVGTGYADDVTSPGHPLPPNSPSASLRARLHDATLLLESIAASRSVLAGVPPEDRQRLLGAVASVYSPDRVERRRMARVTARARKAARVKQTEVLRDETAIRSRHRRPVFHSPNVFLPADSTEDRGDGAPPSSMSTLPGAAIGAAREAADAQHCYVCKQAYSVIHHFYDQLCPSCAELNFFKRTELADLRGRVALLTGGRVKIGFQAGLKLLRSGAHVIVTTRFPRNAARRYASEPDFADWKDRLEIFGLDLRHTPSVEAFCRELLSTCRRLDFIVNNACQTVRRPPEFYVHMMAEETSAFRDMPRDVRQLVVRYEEWCRQEALPDTSAQLTPRDGLERTSAWQRVAGLAAAAQLSQVALLPEEFFDRRALFPRDQLDHDLQQVDLRLRNSWRLLLADVSTVELLEVHLVNAIGPFVINARLKPLLVRTPERDKHIVNVSAVEGQFYRRFKTTRHPHTNMAKAALNMMTRTSAADYHQDGIHMNSVDTGWVTDEDTVEIARRKTVEQRFHPPLDVVDGAARIVDPIVSGFNSGTHVWGQFLKDFRATDW